MRRLWLLSSLAFAVGCNCGTTDYALKVVVKVSPAQRATCAVLEVSDGTTVRATQELLRAGKDELVVGLKRGELPETVSLRARGYLSADGCATPRNWNGDSAAVSATFPAKGVDTVTLALDAPDAVADVDRDGYVQASLGGLDCNDNDGAVHPGAAQSCTSNEDQDCDGATGCSDSDCVSQPACQRTPDRIVFVNAPLTVEAGACSPELTLEAQDAAGAAAAQQGLPAVLTANPAAGVTFYADAACATAVTSVTIALGQTRAGFHFKATQGGTTFTATATVFGLTPAAQLETVSFPAAMQLAFSNPPRTVQATACSGALTIELRDVSGAPTQTSAAIAVAVTGAPATGLALFTDASCTTALAGGVLTLAANTSSATFYASDTTAGPIALTGASAGLNPAQQTLTVTPGAPAQLRFTSGAQGIPIATCSSAVTVTAQDANANASPVSADTVVSLTANPGAGFAFYSDSGCTAAVTQATIAAGASGASFFFKGANVASVLMTASTSTLGSDTQTAGIGVGPPARLVITTAAQTVVAGNCSGLVTVQSRDASGNPSNVTGSALAVALVATPSTPLQFFSDPGCGTASTGPSIAVGQAATSFYFRSTLAGVVQVAVSSSLPTGDQQNETINAAAAFALAFLGTAQTVTAGICSAQLFVEARDQYGNTATVSGSTALALSSTPAGVTFHTAANCSGGSTVTSVDIAASGTQAGFYARATVADAYALRAQSTGLGFTTQGLTVGPAAVNKLVMTPAARTVVAGACSEVVTVERQDAFSNPVTTGGALTVNLGSGASGGAFSFHTAADCNGGSTVTSVDIAAAASTATFYMRATKAEVVAVTGAASGVANGASHALTVSPAAVDKLVFTPAARTVVAGACSEVVTVERQDAFSNPVTTGGALTVNLGSNASGGAFTFHTAANCSGGSTVSSLSIAASASTATFYMRAEKSEVVAVTGAASGVPNGASHALTVNPATANTLVFAPLAQTVTAGVCSAQVTVERRDAFGNAATTGALTVNLGHNATGGAFTFHTAANCSGGSATASVAIAASASTATFYLRAEKAEAVTVTGAGSGITNNASQTVTVNPGPAYRTTFTSAAVTVAVNTCSTAVTVQQQDEFGNAVAAAADTAVALTDDGAGFDFHLAAGCGDAATGSATIASGSASTTFYVQGSTVGAVTMTATITGLTTAGTQQASVEAAGVHHLAFTTPARSSGSGVCSAVLTVQRQDASNNPVTVGGPLTVNLSSTAASGLTFWTDANCTTTGVTSVTISGGNSSANLYVKALVAETVTLTASDGVLQDGTQAFTTTVGAATKLVVTSAPQTLPALGCSALTTVTLQDVGGNTVTTGGALAVNLTDSAGAPTITFYSDAACTAAVVSRSMGAGTSTVDFYFKGGGTGTSTLSAAGGAYAPGTQLETFSPAIPTRLAFTTAAPTVEAGFCQALTLERRGDDDLPTAPSSATAITGLTASPTPTAPLLSTQFFSDNACTTLLATPFNIAANQSSTVLYVKGRSGSVSGAATASQVYGVTATASGLTDGTLNVTVLPMVRRGTCRMTSGLGASDTSVTCAITPSLSSIERTMLVYTASGSERSRPDDDMVTCRLRVNGSSLGEVVCERLGTLVAVTASIPTNELVIHWQTVSFAYPASAGGVSVQHLTTAFHSATVQNVNIPTASPRTSSFVLFSARRPASFGPGPTADVSVDGNDLFMAEMTSNTNVQLTFGTGGTFAANGSASTAFDLQVVNWSGATAVHNTAPGGTGLSFGVTRSTPNLARTILLYSSRMASIGGTADANMCARRLSGVITDGSNLTFQRGCAGTSPADDLGTISWQWVELPSNVAVQRNGANPLTGTLTVTGSTVNFATAVDRTRAVAFTGGQGTGGLGGGRTNSNLDRLACAQANISFNSATQLQLSRITNNDQGDFGLFVMEVTP